MACKSMVGAHLLMATCVALGGCQTTPPPRTTYPQTYNQRPGTVTSPQLATNPQALSPTALNMPATGAPMGPAVNGLGGIPTTTPPASGAQFRSTAQPFTPAGSFTPMSGSGMPAGGVVSPATGTAGSNFGSPAFTPTANGTGFNAPPIAPPTNPSAPPALP